MEYLYRLRCGKYGYNWFNLGSNSRNKCPSICCASFTSREDPEIKISPIVDPYRSTLPPFFVDGNCVDGNWLPTVKTNAVNCLEHNKNIILYCSTTPGTIFRLVNAQVEQPEEHRSNITWHYSDVIMSAIASQITGVSVVSSTACSDADQRKHQSSASLAFMRGIHRWPVNSPHKRPVTRKMFPFDDVIMGKCMHLQQNTA